MDIGDSNETVEGDCEVCGSLVRFTAKRDPLFCVLLITNGTLAISPVRMRCRVSATFEDVLVEGRW